MTSAGRRRRGPPLLELAMMLAVLGSTGWTIHHLLVEGFLPQPFVFDTNDTFMDWFNTAYWANHPGAYDVWRSIYPPLSFVFLRLFSLSDCYVASPFAARDCDWLGQATIALCYGLDILVTGLAFYRNDRATALPRTLAFSFGLPLLFTLERGNLILVCFIFFAIAHAPITRSRGVQALATALTINFKPYLLLPALAQGVRREWRPLELAGLATIAIYLVTLALVGAGSIGELVSNTTNWVTFVGGQVWNEINYSTSYAPFLMLDKTGVPLLDFVPSRIVEGVETFVPLAIRSTQIVALACLGAAALRPKTLSHARIAAVMLGAYLVTQSPGGYTQAFLVFLVLLEPARGLGSRIAVLLSYTLLLVGDRMVAPILRINAESWLGGHPVTPEFGLTIGHFLRPGVIILIVWVLSLDGVAQVLGTLRRPARAHTTGAPA